MNAVQIVAFQANSGFNPSDVAVVLVGAVFAVFLVWSVWALRSAYVGWTEQQINQRQLLGVAVRVFALYLVLAFFLLS